MKHEIISFPFPILRIYLEEKEFIKVKKGAFVYAKGEFELKPVFDVKSRKKIWMSFFGGSISYNVFSSKKDTVELNFAPESIGEIFEVLINETMAFNYLPKNHLANYGSLDFGLKFMGIKSYLTSSGFAHIQVKGNGSLFLIGFGTIIELDLAENEKILVDEGFLIGFENTVSYKIIHQSIKKLFLSGEGFLIELTGKGKVYLQSRVEPNGSGSGGGLWRTIDIFT